MACREGVCVCSGDIERENVQGYSAGGGGKFKWKKSSLSVSWSVSLTGIKPSYMPDPGGGCGAVL